MHRVCHFGRRDTSFPDAGPFDDPLIGRIDDGFHLFIRHDPVGQESTGRHDFDQRARRRQTVVPDSIGRAISRTK